MAKANSAENDFKIGEKVAWEMSFGKTFGTLKKIDFADQNQRSQDRRV